MNLVKDYVEAHDLQTRDATDLIEEFGDEIKKMNGKCLDIGCGPAIVTRKFILPRLPNNSNVVGVDISKSMVEFAKTTHSDEERLSFIELDIEADKLPSDQINAYDNAISLYCLHWCQNTRKVFENMYQLLRPGGRALILFLGNNTGFDAYLRLHEDPRYKPYMEDVKKFIPQFQFCNNSRATLKKILEESGFEVLHCSFRERTFIFKNIQTLMKHTTAVNPFLERMPENVKQQYEEDLTRELISRKISFVNSDNGSKEERKVLDRYHVLISYFRKPLN